MVAAVDAGMDAQDAVDAPRLHVEGALVDAEPGVDPDALAALEQRGWELRQWDERNLYFGGVQAVARRADGHLTGGGDPRRGGVAIPVDYARLRRRRRAAQHVLGPASGIALLQRVAGIGGPGGQVDRGLGVGGQHHQLPARGHGLHGRLGHHQRHRAAQPARVGDPGRRGAQ